MLSRVTGLASPLARDALRTLARRVPLVVMSMGDRALFAGAYLAAGKRPPPSVTRNGGSVCVSGVSAERRWTGIQTVDRVAHHAHCSVMVLP